MSITKICGTETEFGISVRGVPDFNPVMASSLVVNAFAALQRRQIRWDFEDEHPGHDARGFAYERPDSLDIETGLANVVLTNGARFYVDHAHPEFSTPECSNALSGVLYDKAGERTLQLAAAAVQHTFHDGEELIIHKNNSDGKGNSYGCHENYLVDRAVPFSRIVQVLTPFFVSRQIFTGAGKTGSENGADEVSFQISQRADFFEEEVGLETTLKRPIINTRDEPHADPERFRRLHVIVGDANMCEIPILLKLGTTSLVLAMIEDDFIEKDVGVVSPVAAMHDVSHDISCRATLRRTDGSTLTPVELQWEFFELAKKWAADQEADAVRERVLDTWERVLGQLETDPMTLHRELDWVAKLRLIEAYRERHGLAADDPKVSLLDLQYHDLRPERGLYYRLVGQGLVETLVSAAAIDVAVSEPPGDTRAFFRGRCIQRFGEQIAAANWDSIVFDLGTDPLQRVPMLDPTRGSEANVGALLSSCDDVEELLAQLSA